MRFSKRDAATIRSYLEFCKAEIRSRGLVFTSSIDAQAFMRDVALCPETNLTWTYHPDFSALDPRHFWWSKLTLADDPRRIVAFNAQRLFETDDLIEDFDLWVVFGDGPPQLDMPSPSIVNHDNLPVLSGRVAMGGAMWTHPNYRRQGIYKFYSPLVQIMSLLKFRYRWYTALYKITEQHQALSKKGARFNRVEPFLEGEYAPHGYELGVSLAWKSGDELLLDIEGLLITGNDKNSNE